MEKEASADSLLDALVTVGNGVSAGNKMQIYGCGWCEPSFGDAGANSRAFDSNRVGRATYFAVMGLLQDTC